MFLYTYNKVICKLKKISCTGFSFNHLVFWLSLYLLLKKEMGGGEERTVNKKEKEMKGKRKRNEKEYGRDIERNEGRDTKRE